MTHTTMNNRRTVDTIPKVALEGLYHPSEEILPPAPPKKKAKVRKAERTIIETLAQKGCTMSEVGTAFGLTQNQMAEILEDENHPFNSVFWDAKIAYTQKLRDIAIDIAENGDDVAVRARMVEFLAKENSTAFENKRLHTGYTNIKKLLSLVRQQFIDENGKIHRSPFKVNNSDDQTK
jgi:deoxyribodipyrimidine photolyase